MITKYCLHDNGYTTTSVQSNEICDKSNLDCETCKELRKRCDELLEHSGSFYLEHDEIGQVMDDYCDTELRPLLAEFRTFERSINYCPMAKRDISKTIKVLEMAIMQIEVGIR